jgi:hypothetical protein
MRFKNCTKKFMSLVFAAGLAASLSTLSAEALRFGTYQLSGGGGDGSYVLHLDSGVAAFDNQAFAVLIEGKPVHAAEGGVEPRCGWVAGDVTVSNLGGQDNPVTFQSYLGSGTTAVCAGARGGCIHLAVKLPRSYENRPLTYTVAVFRCSFGSGAVSEISHPDTPLTLTEVRDLGHPEVRPGAAEARGTITPQRGMAAFDPLKLRIDPDWSGQDVYKLQERTL